MTQLVSITDHGLEVEEVDRVPRPLPVAVSDHAKRLGYLAYLVMPEVITRNSLGI